jgi:hypothetical protein
MFKSIKKNSEENLILRHQENLSVALNCQLFLLFLKVKEKTNKQNSFAKPKVYTYNANHLIPVFSTTIPGNPQYRYPVLGKIRAVLNTGIQYWKKSERYSIPIFRTGKIRAVLNTGIRYRKKAKRYSIP